MHEHYEDALKRLSLYALYKEDFATAERVLRESYALHKKRTGQDTCLSAYDLGHICALKGEYAKASQLLLSIREEMESGKKTFKSEGNLFGGRYSYNVTQSYETEKYRASYKLILALISVHKGSYEEAKRLLVDVNWLHGPRWELTETLLLEKMGRIYCSRGKYSDAEPLFKKALAMRKKALPYNHPILLRNMKLYATVLTKTGQKDDANKMLAKIRRIKSESAK
jgi:tetratricopeptide (TPR) repeat protein